MEEPLPLEAFASASNFENKGTYFMCLKILGAVIEFISCQAGMEVAGLSN
jgi:hypothetical protein